MILADSDILQALQGNDLRIDPFDDRNLQPSSYDLTLSDNFWIQEEPKGDWTTIDLNDPPDMRLIGVGITTDSFILRPHAFVLGSTVERIEIPNYLAARLEGKSSLGRLGLVIHATAGYVDPGFRGCLTLELSNIGSFPLKLHAGMLIAQLTLLRMHSSVNHPYGSPGLKSRYQDQGRMPVPFRPPERKDSA